MTTPLLRIVATDANIIINLMHVSRLGLLGRIPNCEFVVPVQVLEEITIPEQRAEIEAAIAAGWVKVEASSDLDSIAMFTELISRIGRGESACIALAAKNGWHIASDEKGRFLREAEARVGAKRVLTTVDVFILAIKAGLLTIEEADADKATLEGKRFRVKFASYRDLVS